MSTVSPTKERATDLALAIPSRSSARIRRGAVGTRLRRYTSTVRAWRSFRLRQITAPTSYRKPETTTSRLLQPFTTIRWYACKHVRFAHARASGRWRPVRVVITHTRRYGIIVWTIAAVAITSWVLSRVGVSLITFRILTREYVDIFFVFFFFSTPLSDTFQSVLRRKAARKRCKRLRPRPVIAKCAQT